MCVFVIAHTLTQTAFSICRILSVFCKSFLPTVCASLCTDDQLPSMTQWTRLITIFSGCMRSHFTPSSYAIAFGVGRARKRYCIIHLYRRSLSPGVPRVTEFYSRKQMVCTRHRADVDVNGCFYYRIDWLVFNCCRFSLGALAHRGRPQSAGRVQAAAATRVSADMLVVVRCPTKVIAQLSPLRMVCQFLHTCIAPTISNHNINFVALRTNLTQAGGKLFRA